MTLREYLDETGLKQKWIAQRVGISYSMLSLIVLGRRIPTQALAEKLSKLTDERVIFNIRPETPRIGTIKVREGLAD